METCLRGFSNSFMPESVVEAIDLQYIEGGELERAWKSTRRQRLKQQEEKIWDNFVKEQDVLQSVCEDDPYQFLDELPDTYLKELMNTELQKMKLERAEEVAKQHEQKKMEEVQKEEHIQHTVTFAEANENEDNEIFHVFNDEKNEDVSGPEDEVLDESLETPRTVRERDDEAEAAGEPGEDEGGEEEKDTSPVRSDDKSSSKSSENVSNLIESSIYCAKVKDLRMKINEEIYAIMASLDKQHVANVEPQQLRNMCKRSQEFCGRFQRIHMYQLQRQIRDIKRHNSLALPFAKHTQFQSQMVRIVSLHQNMLQSFQVLHKSFEQTLCLRESADMAKSLATIVRDACASCRGCCVPHVPAARDLFTEELFLTCDKLEESINDYVAKVTDFVNATEASVTCSTRSRKAPQNKEKKRNIGSVSKNASKTEADARLSMYSLATIRMGISGKQQTAGAVGTSKGRIMNRAKKGHENQDALRSHRKSPRCRRPLMRDPHSGKARVRVPMPSDQEIRTMVEVVEPPSSHMSREGSPHGETKPPRRRSTGPSTPRTPKVKASNHMSREGSPRAEAKSTPRTPKLKTSNYISREGSPGAEAKSTQRTAKLKEMKSKPSSPLGSPAPRLKPRVSTALSSIRSEAEDTVIEQMSPVSKIQCAWKVKEAEDAEGEQPKEPVSDRRGKEKPKTPDLAGCEVTRLLRQLCGGDTTVGNRNERSSGAKNAQLLCVNGGSPRQPSTPQLLKILEETIQKKVPKSMYRKPPKSKDVDRLRLNFNIPDKTAENLFQYRTKFVQHMLTSSMYANCAVGKPWEMISSVSEQIIDDLLLASAKEMEIQNVLKDLYDIETS